LPENLVKRFVECQDPVEEVWKILVEIWKPCSNPNAYFRQEEKASEVELKIHRIFFEIYDYIYNRIKAFSIPIERPLLIVDGLSIREGNLLVEDFQKNGYEVVEYGYTLSRLPSVTQRFRNFLNQKYIEIKSGKIPSEVDPSKPVWITFPDEILHHAEFVQPPEAYERTKEVLFKVLDKLGQKDVTIISDHGYIMTDYVWALESADRRLLKEKVFGAYRYTEIPAIDKNVLSKLKEIPKDVSYIYMDEEYCYVRGRFFWPISGYGKTVAHGGLSLMECIVPKFKVRK